MKKLVIDLGDGAKEPEIQVAKIIKDNLVKPKHELKFVTIQTFHNLIEEKVCCIFGIIFKKK